MHGSMRQWLVEYYTDEEAELMYPFQYQQIFAISQALPGSASAKMLFCINAVHGGFSAGCLAFAFFW